MNWKKYGGGYLLALIVVTVLYYLIDMLLGGDSSNTSMMLVAPVVAAIYPTSAFVKDHRRVPDSQERWQLLGLCFGIFVAVQLIQIGVVTVIFADQVGEFFDSLDGGLLAIVMLVTLLLEFALMWLLFRFYPGYQLKSMIKAEERKAAKGR
ncbi:ABZJ_00895 family protein [Gordonia phthalatica]|uniref:Uncharacterized protein n=1 Tax=Gordonia phthalatica TaxID=1136941 RepID=A0A0N9MZW6_9ACTN|nr:ABZJ_00895 family protein [Gordonia phthalatica]ALG83342.1 hypothetical protein ACH46_00980 [Gordonia phthalatica]